MTLSLNRTISFFQSSLSMIFMNSFFTSSILEALEKNGKCRMFFGSYSNLPTEEIVCGSQLMAELAESLGTDDLLIVCLTGGGSALLTLPVEFQSS